jgi:kinesin family member 2/24
METKLIRLESYEYYVDRVYHKGNTTEEIYETLVKPLVNLAKNGGIGTVFAYGQTGAGKTYTINALENLVAADLLSSFPHDHNIFVSIFELGGTLNSAFGMRHVFCKSLGFDLC